MIKINFNKYKKHLIVIFVVILVVLGFYYYKNKGPEMKLITNSEEYGEFIAKGGSETEYLEWVKELEKLDNYGGKTPEETLDLYIKALESGDFELASKYFVLEDQEREFDELVTLDQSKIDSYLEVLKDEEKVIRYNEIMETYSIEVPFEKEFALLVKFIKNKETDIWKLESI
jgi:hypothetical protein